MPRVSKVTCHDSLGDNVSIHQHPTTTILEKHSPFMHDFGRLRKLGKNGVRMTLWKLHNWALLACSLWRLKIVQEWSMLLPTFGRLQKQQKRILWSPFKNEGVVRSRAASGRPQGPVNGKRTPPEGKQCIAGPGESLAMGTIMQFPKVYVPWGIAWGRLFEW